MTKATIETVRLKTIQCRVSDEEYAEVAKKADKLGVSVSSYLRMVCLLAEIKVTLKPEIESND